MEVVKLKEEEKKRRRFFFVFLAFSLLFGEVAEEHKAGDEVDEVDEVEDKEMEMILIEDA